MNYDDYTREDLIKLIEFYRSELKLVKPRQVAQWEDRMGGQFTQEEIDESKRNNW